jgi:hypothetical protein
MPKTPAAVQLGFTGFLRGTKDYLEHLEQGNHRFAAPAERFVFQKSYKIHYGKSLIANLWQGPFICSKTT